MSGTGNNASGATIFTDNTVAGGPNDVVVSNLTVSQDMRVDGNFEVGTFSIDDLTVNNDLSVTDALTVGGNATADYLETTNDINCHGSLFLDNNIVGNGLSYDRPLKRLRVDNAANVSDVLAGSVVATNGTVTSTLDHNKIYIARTGAQGHIHLNGNDLEVGLTTSTGNLELITNNLPRVVVSGTTGQTNVTSTVSSTSTTSGALVIDGGVGIAGAINIGGGIGTFTGQTPFKIDLGNATIPSISANNAATVTITFNTTFATAPRVFVTPLSGSSFGYAVSVTGSGCNIGGRNVTAGTVTNVPMQYLAIGF